MKLLLLLLLLSPCLTSAATRRSRSAPPTSRTSQGEPPTKPLFQPTKAKVTIWGPGTSIVADPTTMRMHPVTAHCQRSDSLTSNHCAVRSATIAGGRALVKVKGEMAHFQMKTERGGFGTVHAKGQGMFTGAIVTPSLTYPMIEEVNGSKQILVGPETLFQGILHNHGRGRGRVSMTGYHEGVSKTTAVGENTRPS